MPHKVVSMNFFGFEKNEKGRIPDFLSLIYHSKLSQSRALRQKFMEYAEFRYLYVALNERRELRLVQCASVSSNHISFLKHH